MSGLTVRSWWWGSEGPLQNPNAMEDAPFQDDFPIPREVFFHSDVEISRTSKKQDSA